MRQFSLNLSFQLLRQEISSVDERLRLGSCRLAKRCLRFGLAARLTTQQASEIVLH